MLSLDWLTSVRGASAENKTLREQGARLTAERDAWRATAGDILPNPQMPNWPKEMQTTILLEEVGDKTRLQLIWQPINPTQEEAEAFEASRAEHDKGWGGGLEQLDAYLATL